MNLQQLSRDHMREAKREIERTDTLRPLFRAYYENGSHYDFLLPAGTEHILSDGRSKEILFDFLRRHTIDKHVAAWVFLTDVYSSKSTPEGAKHLEEFDKYQDTGFETLQKMGWVTVTEALLVLVQDGNDVVTYTQPYSRKPRINWLGPPEEKVMKQDDFGGRQKMYGATTSDIVGQDRSRDTSGPVGVELMNE
jgi:hypothetical protein